MALYKNKKMNDLVAKKPFHKGDKYQINDLLPKRPKGLKGEALKMYIQKKMEQGKKDIMSKPVKPGKKWTKEEMANAKPKPMPQRPGNPGPMKPRPNLPVRPVPGRPGMTYRGKSIVKGQKQRVMAKLKQMRENA